MAMKVNNMELAKVLFDPKKVRILNAAENEAKTVKEIAGAIHEQPSRLYYHINKLLELGLLEITETKQVGNLSEKYYRTADKVADYNMDESFVKENADYVIKEALAYLNRGVEILKRDIKTGAGKEDFHSQLSLVQAELSREDWIELSRDLRKLIDQKKKEAVKKKGGSKLPITYVLMSYTEE
jgi:DNA-binding transcriptional ArsR family regulator